MSGMPPKVNPLAQLISKYSDGAKAALDAGRNDLATQAYARGGNALRSMARDPRYRSERLHIEEIAAQFDLWASQANMPYVDPTSSDFPFVDDWSDDNPQLPTEFDGVVADFGDAKLLPDGSPADELEASAQFARFQKARQYQVSRPVQVTPESANNDGNLFSNTVLVQYGSGGSTSGGSYTGGILSAGVAASQEAEVIRWDGTGNSECMPCRVAISRQERGTSATFPTGNAGAGNTYVYRPYFRVRWGTGERGTANEVVGDVGRGIQFTVNASHIYVNVGMDAPPATGAYLPGSMTLNGSLGYFAGASQAPVLRTIFVDALTDGSTNTFTVPLFAVSLMPPANSVFIGTYTLDFLDNNSNVISSLGPIAGGGIIEPIPLPCDVYQVKVTNNFGGTQNYRFPFLLSL